MRHPRSCPAHYPGISSNINNATDFRTPPTPLTLAHQPSYPHCHNTHVTHTSTPPTLTRIARHFWNSNLVCQVTSAVYYFIRFYSFFRMFFPFFLSYCQTVLKTPSVSETPGYILVRFQWSSVNPKWRCLRTLHGASYVVLTLHLPVQKGKGFRFWFVFLIFVTDAL